MVNSKLFQEYNGRNSLSGLRLLLIGTPSVVLATCTRGLPQIDLSSTSIDILRSTGGGPAPHLILVDPFVDVSGGLEVIAEVRSTHRVPFMIVSQHADPVDRAIAIELGAIDYIAVPFFEREFLARVRRHLVSMKSSPGDAAAREIYQVQGICIDVAQREVRTASGEVIDFTAAEFDLLVALVRSPRQVLSREQLMKNPGKSNAWETTDRAIDVLIAKVRRKLSTAGGDTLIKTIRNGGYLLTVDPIRR